MNESVRYTTKYLKIQTSIFLIPFQTTQQSNLLLGIVVIRCYAVLQLITVKPKSGYTKSPLSPPTQFVSTVFITYFRVPCWWHPRATMLRTNSS